MSPSILVVDDDPAFRGLARRILTAMGMEVLGEADTVAAAMAVAVELRPDGALVDISLPDGDGVALAGALAALVWPPRVVLTSSDAEAAGPDEVRRSGALAFVSKDQLPNAPLHRLLGGS